MENNVKCPECGKVFNLLFGEDADQWYFGHDCEINLPPLPADWPIVTDGFLGGAVDEEQDERDPAFDETEEWTWVRDQGL